MLIQVIKDIGPLILSGKGVDYCAMSIADKPYIDTLLSGCSIQGIQVTNKTEWSDPHHKVMLIREALLHNYGALLNTILKKG